MLHTSKYFSKSASYLRSRNITFLLLIQCSSMTPISTTNIYTLTMIIEKNDEIVSMDIYNYKRIYVFGSHQFI